MSSRPRAVNQILQPTAGSRGVGGEGQRDEPFAVCGHSLPMKPDSHQQWSLQVHSQQKGSTRTRGKLCHSSSGKRTKKAAGARQAAAVHQGPWQDKG